MPEDASFTDAQKVYRELSQKASWSDIKELNAAFEIIRGFFAIKDVPQERAETIARDVAVRFPVPEKPRSSGPKIAVIIAIACLIALAAVVLHQSKALRFLRSQDNADLSSIIKMIKPSIVSININDTTKGSGFVVSKDGYIVTNAHVMRERSAKASFFDGTSMSANLVFIDPERDFALLKADVNRDFPFLSLADSSSCSEGDTVIAAGTPLSFETTFTRGIVSATKRVLPAFQATFIQTDAALSPGNSGGPLLNMKGNVIGINSLKLLGANVEGIGFAVSINDVKSYIEKRQHMDDAEISRGLTRMEKKIEEMSRWRDQGGQTMKDKAVEEQWEYERRRREFANRVDEANKTLREQKEKEERRIREDAEQYRAQMRQSAEMKRKALSDCMERVQAGYINAWNESCNSLNLDTQCKLPYSQANILEQRHMQARNECFRLYPQ